MLSLRNPRYPELPSVEVEALADTGATFLCVPAAVAEALRLETANRKQAVLADGRRQSVPYAGPVEMRFGNRVAFGGALVMGRRVRLGAIPVEDMDLTVHPLARRVAVNPAGRDVLRVAGCSLRERRSLPTQAAVRAGRQGLRAR